MYVSGVALQTQFTISCEGWHDEGPGGEPSQLVYVVEQRFSGSDSDSSTLTDQDLTTLTESQAPSFSLLLPPGGEGEKLPLVVGVRDNLEATARMSFDVKVNVTASRG